MDSKFNKRHFGKLEFLKDTFYLKKVKEDFFEDSEKTSQKTLVVKRHFLSRPTQFYKTLEISKDN